MSRFLYFLTVGQLSNMKLFSSIILLLTAELILAAGPTNNSSGKQHRPKYTPRSTITQRDSPISGTYSVQANHVYEAPGGAPVPTATAASIDQHYYYPQDTTAGSATYQHQSYGVPDYSSYYYETNGNSGHEGPTYKYKYHIYPDPAHHHGGGKGNSGWNNAEPTKGKGNSGYGAAPAKGKGNSGWGSEPAKGNFGYGDEHEFGKGNTGWGAEPNYDNEGWSGEQYGDDDKGEKGGAAGGAGAVGLAGILGLAGLKGLLPLAGLIPLLLLPLLLFIPLPFIYFPPGQLDANNGVLKLGRASEDPAITISFLESKLQKSMKYLKKFISESYDKFSSASNKNQCTERISCEVYRVAKRHKASKLLDTAFRKLFPTAKESLARASKEGDNTCDIYTCEPIFKALNSSSLLAKTETN